MDFLSKTSLSDFTRDDFIRFVQRLRDPNAGTEDQDQQLVAHFNAIVPVPAGSDLIFWPEDGADISDAGIADTVETWCRENGLPGFRQG